MPAVLRSAFPELRARWVCRFSHNVVWRFDCAATAAMSARTGWGYAIGSSRAVKCLSHGACSTIRYPFSCTARAATAAITSPT
jgi:hypothetical protein